MTVRASLVRLYNSENLDVTAKTAAFTQAYTMKPTAGVASLNVDAIANIAADANACYAVGMQITQVRLYDGGRLLYSCDGRARQVSTTVGVYEPNPLSANEGPLGVMNRAFFGAPPLHRITTLSSLSGTNSDVGCSFKLLVYRPKIGGKEMKVEVDYAAANDWLNSAAAAETGLLTMRSVSIEAQYSDNSPEFEYLNNEKTGVGASLTDSTDGFALDKKTGYYVIGGIFDLVQSSNFENHITRVRLLDSNNVPYADMTDWTMKKEEEDRSSPYIAKADATTGLWSSYPHSNGSWFCKVDGVESDGSLKWAITTNASASSATVRVLTILRAEGTTMQTQPGKAPVSTPADQSGAGTAKGR